MLIQLQRTSHLLTPATIKTLSSISQTVSPMICASQYRNFSKRIHENFSFPKHKELFSNDFISPRDQDDDEFLEPGDDIGIMRKYKARKNITAEDVMARDMKQVQQNLQKQIANTYSYKDGSGNEMMETTQNIISRLRRGKGLKTVGQDFKRKRLQNEYLNYGKYQKNYITQQDQYNPDDNARDTLSVRNYRDAMKRLSIKNSEQEKNLDRKILDFSISKNKFNQDREDWKYDYATLKQTINT